MEQENTEITEGYHILDTDSVLKIMWSKITSIDENAKGGYLLEIATDLGIKRSTFFDLKKYIEDGSVRERRVLPLGTNTIKDIMKSLGMQYVEVMHCIKV